jgi:hypothetical protein
VASVLLKGLRSVELSVTAVSLNGAPACRFEATGHRRAAVSVDVSHGRIERIYIIANPNKLSSITQVTHVTRT